MSTRPKTQNDRERCIEALERLFVPGCTHQISPLVRAELESKYLPAVNLYNETRARYHAKKSSETGAQEELDRAAELHDRTFRNWRNSVENTSGRILSIDLRKVLGTSPSELLKLPNRERLRATESLRVRLADLPRLKGDPERLEHFLDARDRLAKHVAHFDRAEQARIAAKESYDEAIERFEQRFQDAAVLLEQIHPEVAAVLLPEIAASKKRQPKAKKPPEKASQPASQPAEEPSPVEKPDEASEPEAIRAEEEPPKVPETKAA